MSHALTLPPLLPCFPSREDGVDRRNQSKGQITQTRLQVNWAQGLPAVPDEELTPLELLQSSEPSTEPCL